MKVLAALSVFVCSAPVAAQCVETRLFSNSQSAAQFGRYLDGDGSRFLVQASHRVVELHEVVPGGTALLERFRPPPGGSFSAGVGVDGNTVLIGGYGANSSEGAVHAYEFQAGVWNYTQTFFPSDLSVTDGFGYYLTLDGDRVAVGVPNQGFVGAVYLYQRVGGTWTLEQKFNSPIGGLVPNFGLATALDDDVLVVGAPFANMFAGMAFVYERGANGWPQAPTLVLESSSPVTNGRFGIGLALDNGLLAVGETGASMPESASGRISIHERAQGWARTAELAPDNLQESDQLGGSLALSGTTLLAGATMHGPGFFSPGAAYAFELGANGWEETAYMAEPTAETNSLFGTALAITPTHFIIGAPLVEPDGSVWIIDRASPGGFASYCPGALNSTGGSGALVPIGTFSVLAQSLEFEGVGLLPSEFGLLFYGAGQISVPLGDGTLCVGSPIYRVGLAPADANGRVQIALDWNQAPVASGAGAITSGSTWNFQMWYRDPAGANGSNLTNGLEVTFCP